jgi:hypothetical protein
MAVELKRPVAVPDRAPPGALMALTQQDEERGGSRAVRPWHRASTPAAARGAPGKHLYALRPAEFLSISVLFLSVAKNTVTPLKSLSE